MLPPPDSPFAASPHDALSSATRTVLESAGNIVAHVTSTSSSTSSPTSSSAPGPNGECELLGPFAILVQATLGLAAIMSLVFKRYRERPQRPLKIWFFDVSKQVFGSVLVHIANLLMSMLSSGQFSVMAEPVTVSAAAGSSIVQRVRRMTEPKDAYVPNPCSFYLLNLAIDVRYLSMTPSSPANKDRRHSASPF